MALPFYVQFLSKKEVKEFCKQNMKDLKINGNVINIKWDSQKGEELLETMILSKEVIYLETLDIFKGNCFFNLTGFVYERWV